MTNMKFLKKKVLKCLWVMKDADIGLLRPATIPQLTAEVVDIDILILSYLPFVSADDIILVTVVEVDIGHKRPANLYLSIREHALVLKGEVDIGIKPYNLTPIIKASVVDC